MPTATAAKDAAIPRHLLFPQQQITASIQSHLYSTSYAGQINYAQSAAYEPESVDIFQKVIVQQVRRRLVWVNNQLEQEKAQKPEAFRGIAPEVVQFFTLRMAIILLMGQPTSLALTITPDDSVYFTARYGYRTVVTDIYFEPDALEPVETIVLIDEQSIPKPGFTGSFAGAAKHINQYLLAAMQQVFDQAQNAR